MTLELDHLGIDLCTAGLVPWKAIGQAERTAVIVHLTDLRLSAAEIATRLGITKRTVARHRAKARTPAAVPVPEPLPPAATEPPSIPERNTVHTIDEIRGTAENLIADMQSAPDLLQVRANCVLIAEADPLLAAQVMMALASWIPLEATPNWLQKNEDMLVAERNAFRLELVG